MINNLLNECAYALQIKPKALLAGCWQGKSDRNAFFASKINGMLITSQAAGRCQKGARRSGETAKVQRDVDPEPGRQREVKQQLKNNEE